MTEQERREKYGVPGDEDYWLRGLLWDHFTLPPCLCSRFFKVPDVKRTLPAARPSH